MNRASSAALGVGGLLVRAAVSVLAANPSAVTVEPSELARRGDLVGFEVIVDDRIASYHYREGRITLKRTPILFRLPPRLRSDPPRRVTAARIQGVLRSAGNQGACDVTAIEFFPSDLERLNQTVAALSSNDFEHRDAWARWAERRGAELQDHDLLERARALEGEAIRIEAALTASDSQKGKAWLALARKARDHHVPEPESSALAHAAFRARLAEAGAADDLRALVDEIASFFPRAARPVQVDLGAWEGPFAQDPASGYLALSAAARAALDHRLWADATQRLLERRAADAPQDAPRLADQASAQLPDRPLVARRLLDQGLATAARELGSLRRADVEAIARLYREKLGQPGRARALVRDWLDDQRQNHLNPTDAEGRFLLAGQYESMLGDQATATELLRAAWKIDPRSKAVADAFRRRGFRKVNEEWVEPPRSRDADVTLRNRSPREVRARLGSKPDRVVWSASQGQLIEQWIYLGPTLNQYVNILHTPGVPVPRVVADYTRPRAASEPLSAP
jgi:hypothetical protein